VASARAATVTQRKSSGKLLKANEKLETSPAQVQAGKVLHKVRPGETLYGIAGRYNTSVAALQRDNQVTSTIHPGDVLVIRLPQGN
jgi:LysM repeat protein